MNEEGVVIINKSSKTNTERGFSLVEVLISMVILALVMTFFFPMLTMSTVIMKSNQAKMIADSLARQEIESTLAFVTSHNYNSNNISAPLRIGTFTETNRLISGISFTINKTVSWVDDPADGLYPIDPIPFDYKKLAVIVWAPAFSNSRVTQTTEFDTYIAREGTADPVTGVIVEVVRGWKDAEGNTSPVSGAYVEITGVGDFQTGITNENGQVILPTNFSSDNPIYNVTVQASGMIMHPNPIHGNQVTANQWKTEKIIMEVEKPSKIRLSLNSNHGGGSVSLKNSQIGDQQAQLQPGQKMLTLDNIWPVGSGYSSQYILEVNNLKVYAENFSDNDGNYNSTSYHTEGKPVFLWDYAANVWHSAGQHSDYEGDRWLKSPAIDLTNYDCSGFESAGLTIIGTVNLSVSETIADEKGVVYISSQDNSPALCTLNESDWNLFYKEVSFPAGGELSYTKSYDNLEGIRYFFTDSFHLAICSFPEMDIELKKLEIQLGYTNNNVQFDKPGDTISFSINKQL